MNNKIDWTKKSGNQERQNDLSNTNFEDTSDSEDDNMLPMSKKYDESIVVRNAEEIKSPVHSRPTTMKKSTPKTLSNEQSDDHFEINSPREKSEYQRKLSGPDSSYEKPVKIESDLSDSEETDDDDIQGSSIKKPIELYNPKDFEDLEVSAEVKELFQNITRYTPQKIELNYKLAPHIPDYIPAVGDIDGFLKIPRPDGIDDKLGLIVLDEPCSNQSDPAVLHLKLRSQSKSADPRKQTLIKRIDDAENNHKAIDKWIEDMNQLHRSKHPPSVRINTQMPDIDTLMQQWPTQVEDKLNDAQIDLSKLDCDLPNLVDIVCNLIDIPVQPDTRIESLHTLFTLFLEVRNISDRNF
ncbi:hypothetical protein HCN44_005873 [Aphidius gifuensis]|uniref:Intraflagellar transport protein 46 homolog n=1 Tax=Aphidius gifuensis TaxID=684658 RepID=A0A835CRA5_APHGI|nr:hypothetical protein HCN44_005873 [Aphidius gifuensis]